MATTILTPADLMVEDTFYYVPIRSDMARDVARLQGVITLAEVNFCNHFEVVDTDITGVEKLEALKYWTFAEWAKAERFRKTQTGPAVDPTLIKGQPVYDLAREVECRNTAITFMNKFRDNKLPLIQPFFNY